MSKWVRIRTKNATSRPLRRSILVDDWAVVRLGSRTPIEEIFPNKRSPIEINKVSAIENSRSKVRMKSCFTKLKVPQAKWWQNLDKVNLKELSYPIIAKRIYGFQGRGMSLLNSEKELRAWLDKHSDTSGWIFEKFYNYAREYRCHVARGIGVFMSWRKLRTKEATERWFFNSTNCEWFGENHRLFDRPKCWDAICEASMLALEATGLDIGAVDIRVQSNKEDNPKFIVCEINSAPALGNEGIIKYRKVIKELVNNKINERRNNL